MIRFGRSGRRAALVFVGLTVWCHPVFCIELAIVTGVISDGHGRPVAGALVTLSGVGVGTVSARTGADGRYRFPALRPRTLYRVRAESEGRRTVEYDGFYLDPERTRVVDFRLKAPDEWDAVVLASQDPFPYEAVAQSFARNMSIPVRIIDLDAEPDAEDRVRRVAAEKPNIVLGAGLRSAHLIRRDITDIPSILTLIDDPRRYDLTAPNLCFLGNNPSPDSVVLELRTLLPRARRLGIVYDADRSALLVRDLREAAERQSLSVVLRPLHAKAQVASALDPIRDQIDALLVPYDPLSASPRRVERIVAWAKRRNLPLMAPGLDWVRAGALFGFGMTPEQVGAEAARLAGHILDQTIQPIEIGIVASPNPLLTVNRRVAADLGIPVPPGLRIDMSY